MGKMSDAKCALAYVVDTDVFILAMATHSFVYLRHSQFKRRYFQARPEADAHINFFFS